MRTRERVQFLVEPGAKDRYRRVAYAEGRTLSDWLRCVADAAASQDPERNKLRTRASLEEFFQQHEEFERVLADGPGGRR